MSQFNSIIQNIKKVNSEAKVRSDVFVVTHDDDDGKTFLSVWEQSSAFIQWFIFRCAVNFKLAYTENFYNKFVKDNEFLVWKNAAHYFNQQHPDITFEQETMKPHILIEWAFFPMVDDDSYLPENMAIQVYSLMNRKRLAIKFFRNFFSNTFFFDLWIALIRAFRDELDDNDAFMLGRAFKRQSDQSQPEMQVIYAYYQEHYNVKPKMLDYMYVRNELITLPAEQHHNVEKAIRLSVDKGYILDPTNPGAVSRAVKPWYHPDGVALRINYFRDMVFQVVAMFDNQWPSATPDYAALKKKTVYQEPISFSIFLDKEYLSAYLELIAWLRQTALVTGSETFKAFEKLEAALGDARTRWNDYQTHHQEMEIYHEMGEFWSQPIHFNEADIISKPTKAVKYYNVIKTRLLDNYNTTPTPVLVEHINKIFLRIRNFPMYKDYPILIDEERVKKYPIYKDKPDLIDQALFIASEQGIVRNKRSGEFKTAPWYSVDLTSRVIREAREMFISYLTASLYKVKVPFEITMGFNGFQGLAIHQMWRKFIDIHKLIKPWFASLFVRRLSASDSLHKAMINALATAIATWEEDLANENYYDIMHDARFFWRMNPVSSPGGVFLLHPGDTQTDRQREKERIRDEAFRAKKAAEEEERKRKEKATPVLPLFATLQDDVDDDDIEEEELPILPTDPFYLSYRAAQLEKARWFVPLDDEEISREKRQRIDALLKD